MPTRALRRRPIQPVVETVVAALLLVSVPAFSPGADVAPPVAGVALDDSAAASDLARQLPLEVTFADRMGIAQLARLPEPLTSNGAPQMSTHRAGDVAYVVSEQSVVVFLSDGAVTGGEVVLLGHMTSGFEAVAGCVRNCVVQLFAEMP